LSSLQTDFQYPARLSFESPTIAGLAQRPGRSLLGAKPTVGINSASRPLEIDHDIEAMFPRAEAIALNRLNINLIDAGAKHNAPSLRDKIIAFANYYFGFAFAVSLEAKPHFPTSNPLPFDERVGRYVEVLNPDSFSLPASKPAPISIRTDHIGGAGDQHRSQCSPYQWGPKNPHVEPP
jgi:hypothetical protein